MSIKFLLGRQICLVIAQTSRKLHPFFSVVFCDYCKMLLPLTGQQINMQYLHKLL